MNRDARQAPTTAFPYPSDDTWLGFGGLHGGLLCAAFLAASTEQVPGTPATLSAHLYAPVAAGELGVEATVVHPGRIATVAVRIDGRATGLVRVVRDEPGPLTWPPAAPADAVDPARLPRLELPVDFVPFSQYLDIRPISDTRPFGGGDDPRFDVWIRLRPAAFGHRRFTRFEAAAILLDALPPGLYATMTRPAPIPTAEFTAHFAPARFAPSDWVRLRHRTVWATASVCVDETQLVTRCGTLAAQARQFRRIIDPAER